MRASARVVAEADGRGGTRLAVLHGEPPLLARRTGSGAAATVHLVGGAAGPLRGDDLKLTLAVGPGAFLTVRSVAAHLALPGRPGLPPSRLEIHAEVAAGATLRWLPEPLIAAGACDHDTVTHIDVAAGGTLLWREDLVCGRHNEPPGDARVHITVRHAGHTVYRHTLSIGPNAPGWSGPAILGTARAIGTLIAIPAGPGGEPTPTAAIMPLAGPGVLAAAVGADIRQVRAALDPLLGEEGGRGHPPPYLS